MRFCIQPYHSAFSWNYFYDLSLSPTAVDDAATIEVNNSITFDVLANDTHPIAGANLIVSDVHIEPVHGSVVIEPDYQLTYTPNVGFVGLAIITYTVQDATGDEAIGVLRVTVNPVDYPPVAVDDTSTVVQGETLAFDPRTNDTHAGSETMTVTGATLNSGEGTLAFSAVGITYTPPVTFTGDAIITYTIEDEDSETDTGTITVTVTGDGVPTPQPDTATTYEDTAVQVSVLANDTHEDSDSMTVVAASVSASEGVATFDSSTVTLTPAVGFTGSSVVTYTVEDTDGDQVNSTLTVTVNAYPTPVATDDTVTIDENSSATLVDVLSNDTHVIDALTVVSASGNAAELTVAVVSNQVQITPVANFNGTSTVTYVVEDSRGQQDSGDITVTVQPDAEPVAADDTANTSTGNSVVISVLSNDTHADSDDLTITAASVSASEGTVSIINSSTQLQFTPDGAFTGDATITYTVEDENGDTDTGSVTVSVVSDPTPTANDDTGSTDENQQAVFSPLANDSHATDTLTIVGATVDAGEGSVTYTSTTVTFTPATSFSGTATITYTVEDENSDQATADIVVTVNDILPVAVADTASMDQGTTTLIDVLGNDTHAYGETLTLSSPVLTVGSGTVTVESNQIRFTPSGTFSGSATITYVVSDPDGDVANGTLTVTVDGVPTAVDDTASTDENVTIDIDVVANDTHNDDSLTVASVNLDSGQGAVSIVSNQIRYVPQTSFSGTAVISYTVEDSNGDTDTGSVTVTVTNIDPVAVDDTASTNEDQSVLVDVLSNDTHANNETLTISAVSIDGAEGTATVESGQIRYTPASGFYGTATITYTVSDGDSDTDTGTLTITVAQDYPPVAVDDTATTTEETAVTFDVIDNDTHAGSEAVNVVAATLTSGSGSLSYSGTDITYTPAAAFVGTAVITYTSEDATGDQDTGTLTVTVNAEPVPVAVDDTHTMTTDTTATIDVLSNDTHSASDTLTLISASADVGTASVVSNQVEYTPTAAYVGTAVITYVVEDENGDQDTGTLTITVEAAGADPFDDPASTLFALMVDGSTSGVGKTNCNLWSKKVGINGANDATEWRTNGGSRSEVSLNIADDFTTDDYWVRCRFRVTTAGTAKTYVQFNNEYMDPYEVWFDVTDDATTDAARVVYVGTNVSDATAAKHPTNGFIYVKFRINFSTQSDANGTNTINMSDQDNTGDNLMDVNNLTVIATQDYTFELIT